MFSRNSLSSNSDKNKGSDSKSNQDKLALKSFNSPEQLINLFEGIRNIQNCADITGSKKIVQVQEVSVQDDRFFAVSTEPKRKKRRLVTKRSSEQKHSWIQKVLRNYPIMPGSASLYKTQAAGTGQTDDSEISRAKVLQKLLADVDISQQLIEKFRKVAYIDTDAQYQNSKSASTAAELFSSTAESKRALQQKKQKLFLLRNRKAVRSQFKHGKEVKSSEQPQLSPKQISSVPIQRQVNSKQPSQRKIFDCLSHKEVKRKKLRKEVSGITIESGNLLNVKFAPDSSSLGSIQQIELSRKVEVNQMKIYGQTANSFKPQLLTSVLSNSKRIRGHEMSYMNNTQIGPLLNADIGFVKERARTPGIESIHARKKFLARKNDFQYNSRERLFSGRPTNMESTQQLVFHKFKIEEPQISTFNLPYQSNLTQFKRDDMLLNTQGPNSQTMYLKAQHIKQASLSHMPNNFVVGETVLKSIEKRSSIYGTCQHDHGSSAKRGSAKNSQESFSRLQNQTLSHLDLHQAIELSSAQQSIRSRPKSSKSKSFDGRKGIVQSQHKPVLCATIEEQIAHQRTLYVVPKMLRYESEVGNSNKMPLDTLKPKWVEKVEIDRAKNTDGSLIVPNIVSNFQKQIDSSNLTLLMTTSCFKFTENIDFKRPETTDIKKMNKQFFREPFVIQETYGDHHEMIRDEHAKILMEERRKVLVEGFEYNSMLLRKPADKRKIKVSRTKLPSPIKDQPCFPSQQEVMGEAVEIWRFNSDEFNAQLDLLNSVSLDLVDEWIEPSLQTEQPQIKAVLMEFENQQQTIITNPDAMYVAYVALIVMQKFALNYFRHVQQRQLGFLMNTKLFSTPRKYKNDLTLRLPWFSLLSPPLLKSIYLDRSNQDRDQIHKQARATTLTIKEIAESMGISSDECFDYPEEEAIIHKRNNETFNQIDEYDYGKQPKRLQFQNCFDKNQWGLKPDSSFMSDSCDHALPMRLKKMHLHERFKKVYTNYLMDKDKQSRLLQDYMNLCFKDLKLKQWQKLDNIGSIPDHWNNFVFAKNLHETDLLYQATHDHERLTKELLSFSGAPIFGGKDTSLEALYQLRRKDWKLYGKHICRYLFQKADQKKINPITYAHRSTKSRFKREHALKVEKLSNQILWLDREMGSDLNATSFYKTEFQSQIVNDKVCFGYELLVVKSPMIMSNPVEGWMCVPFFQELLMDQYSKRYFNVQEKLKQWQAAREFKSLVKIEGQLQREKTEQEYVRLVQEIYSKNMHLSAFEIPQSLEYASEHAKSVDYNDTKSQIVVNPQNEIFFEDFPATQANLHPDLLRRSSKLVYRKTPLIEVQQYISPISTPLIKEINSKQTLTERSLTSSSLNQNLKVIKSQSKQSDQRLNEFIDLRLRFAKFVDAHSINILTGKVEMQAKILDIENKNIGLRSQIALMNSQHHLNEISCGSLISSSEFYHPSESSESETESIQIFNMNYRRSLKNPMHLAFSHLQPEQASDQEDVYNQWLVQTTRDFKYKIDEAIKQKKLQLQFDQDSFSSESEQSIEEIMDRQSEYSSNSINSPSFKPPLIIVSPNSDEAVLKSLSKKSSLADVNGESKRNQDENKQMEKLKSYLTKLASADKDQRLADEFRLELEKHFFSAVKSNNVESAMNYLIRFGVNLETKDELYNTALNTAAQAGFSQLALELLRMGADKQNPNIEGRYAQFYDPSL